MDDPKTRSDRDKPASRPAKTQGDRNKAASRAAPALEIACVNALQTQETACTYNFTRTFEHVDWVDVESLVQAGKTPEEGGINERFHRIEADLDALGDNVRRAFACLETLRTQLRVCLNEIVTVLNAKGPDTKPKEQGKDTKDNKDSKETKENKDNKETKDNKDNPDAAEAKRRKDTKESKEDRDKALKERTKEALGAIEKKDQDGPGIIRDGMQFADPVGGSDWPAVTPLEADQRVFIAPDERPALGERALNEPRVE
jgi:hypothetical protein